MSIILDPCDCEHYYLNDVRKKCPYSTYFIRNLCVTKNTYRCRNPWSRIGLTKPFNLTVCRIRWPLDSFKTWDINSLGLHPTNMTFPRGTTPAEFTTSTTLPPPIVSITQPRLCNSSDRNILFNSLIASICIIVLLLFVIIILIGRQMARRGTFSSCGCFQKILVPSIESDSDYVEPNTVRQGQRPRAVVTENNVCENCRGAIAGKISPETGNEVHAYIYLQGNTCHDPDDNRKTIPPEPIEEVVYVDPQAPDIVPNETNKADPIYHTIDPSAVSDSQTRSNERAGDLGSGTVEGSYDTVPNNED